MQKQKLILLTTISFLMVFGFAVSSVFAVSCGQNFTDTRDSQSYSTILIGNQCWMAKNLNYAGVTYYCPNDDCNNRTTYGLLYTQATATSACPSGWHLPTDAEYYTLENYLATESCVADRVAFGCSPAGQKIKTSSWGGNNLSGFTALPAGGMNVPDRPASFGNYGFFWASDFLLGYPLSRELNISENGIRRNAFTESVALSVRCIADSFTVDGACGSQSSPAGTGVDSGSLTSSSPNLCVSGAGPVSNFQIFNGGDGNAYWWKCDGLYGGVSSDWCSIHIKVNGALGTANGHTYASADTSWGSYTQCSAGTSSNTAFPAEGGSTSWTCNGLWGGTNSGTGTAYRTITVVNGSCGTANGQSSYFPPQTNLCATGTASSVAINPTTFTWTCNGSGGGTTASCSSSQLTRPRPCGVYGDINQNGFINYYDGLLAFQQMESLALNLIDVNNNGTGEFEDVNDILRYINGDIATFIVCSFINGSCGTANTHGYTSTSDIDTAVERCATGSFTSFTDNTSYWSWTCNGSGGGTTANCSANKVACGTYHNTIRKDQPASNLCAYGNNTTLNLSNNVWYWSCTNNPGVNAACYTYKTSCGSSNGESFPTAPSTNLCVYGTASSVTTGETTFTWTCTGNDSLAVSCSATRVVGTSCFSCGGLTCTETTDGAYTVHKYTGTGTCAWTTPLNVTSAQLLIVGGGGGGAEGSSGSSFGGSGGAGGLLTGTLSGLSGSYNVTVGAGGAAAAASTSPGSPGGNSSFGSYIAYGGGAGTRTSLGGNGGSGGGSLQSPGSATQTTQGALTGYGNRGGYGSANYLVGGGGGAGGVGGDNNAYAANGMSSSITGAAVTYALGGWTCGGTITAGLGNGGGGCDYGGNGYAKAGSSGTVIIRYLTPVVVNGTCGSSNNGNFSTVPSSNLCSAGTASAVSGTGPWTWTCTGSGGGTTANCSANKIVNGVCGSSHGGAFSTAPSSNLCSAGTASAVSGTGPWTWTCTGAYTGTTANCSAYVIADGACGSSNNGTFQVAPSTNLCSAGIASAVSGAGPWTWTCAGASASWYNFYWSKRKPVTITSSSELTNYQIKVVVAYDSDMQADFDDIRFTSSNGATELSYWLESKTNGSTATFWVKVPSISSGSNTIYVYYGNASATSTSSGDNTFDFFDDFSTASLDTNKWTTTGAAVVAGGIVTVTGGSSDMYIVGKTFLGTNYAMRGRIKTAHWESTTHREFAGLYSASNYSLQNVISHASIGGKHYTNSAGGVSTSDITGGISADTWSVWDIMRNASTSAVFLVDGGNQSTISTNISTSDMAIRLLAGATLNESKVYADWVLIRKYVSAEPTNSVGTEQGNSAIASCSANKEITDGDCGTANGRSFGSVAPANNLCVFGTASAVAQNGATYDWTCSGSSSNSAWTKRKQINVYNPSSALTNYQVKVVVAYDSDMQADFDDIRFTSVNGVTELNYWLESKTDSSTATFWVKIPSLATAGNTIYMYYGNASATSTSSGVNTFDFFDDFSTGSLDTNKWATTGAAVVAGGIVTVTGGSTDQYILGKTFLGTNYAMRGRIKTAHWESTTHREFAGLYASATHAIQNVISHASLGGKHYIYDGSTVSTSDITGGISADTWSVWDIMRNASTSVVFLVDGGNQSTISTNIPTSDMAIRLVAGATLNESKVYADWVLIRKYVSAEPTATIGSETYNPVVTSCSAVRETSTALCGMANGTVYAVAPPDDSLCAGGTPSSLTGSNPWTWTCTAGASVNCSTGVQPVCGSSDGGAFSVSPTDNLCNPGYASTVASNPATWDWTCSPGSWYNSSWLKRKPITISNSGASLTDYQVKINTDLYNETGLAGSWHMNEASGTVAADSSGNVNNGTITGTTVVAGKFGNARSFAATTDTMTITPISLASTDYTIETWFQYPLPSTAGWNTLVRGSSLDHQVIVRRSDLELGFYSHSSPGGFHGSGFIMSTLSDGWHHLAAVGSGTTTAFYVDGEFKGTVDKKSVSDIYSIGNYQGGSQQFGTIDETRIYTRALTPIEIVNHYDSRANLDYGDIRFTSSDGKTELNYWKEKDGTFWVKIPSIVSGSNTIYMYYGNASAASTSNGDNTFPFFDDFLGSSLNAGKWGTLAGSTVSVSNSVVTLTGREGADSRIVSQVFGDGYALRASMKTDHFNSSTLREFAGLASTHVAWIIPCHSSLYGKYVQHQGGTNNTSPIIGGIEAGKFSVWEIARNGSTSVRYQQNDANTVTLTDYAPIGDLSYQIMAGTTTDAKIYADWALFRKYTLIEPTPAAGGEESNPNTVPVSCSADKSSAVITAANFKSPLDIDSDESCWYCTHYLAGDVLQTGKAGNLDFKFTYSDSDPTAKITGYKFAIGTSPDVGSALITSSLISVTPSLSSGAEITYPNAVSVKRNASTVLNQIGYNNTYHWWIKVYNDKSQESDWVEAASTFSTAAKAFPLVRIVSDKTNMLFGSSAQLCATADINNPEDLCYPVCWVGAGTPDLESADWKCSICYNASNAPVPCSATNSNAFTWSITGIGGTINSASVPNPVLTYDGTSVTELRAKLNITGSDCGEEQEEGEGVDVRPPLPKWKEVAP
ncbi:MAG: DUF2341 domain-containing protein [Methanoregulaceae archaeon]|jgi:uncharacterized protein (TIGR02145 family)